MKIQILSKTTTGKVAAFLTLAFIALMGIKMSPLARVIRLPLPTPILAVVGVVGFVFGVISFAKSKDRSVLIFLSLLIGLVIIFWAGAEMLFPH
jgi:uncharacterized membrane protein HdeD (DUF308 family)